MIQVAPGDLVAVTARGRYYYALIVERIRMFGGSWTFAFHRTSGALLAPEALLNGSRSGFNAFVDFIWAKREKRLVRLARKVDASPFRGPGRLKGTHALKEKAAFWFIHDMAFQQLKRESLLSRDEARYPLHETIDDVLMVDRIDAGWTPEQDSRI